MREIKFRVWADTYDRGMHYQKENEQLALFFESIAQKADVIMQYTGLKDKNGKEIYEGDFVQISKVLNEINFITDIFYDKGAFRYRHRDGSGSVMEMSSTKKVKGYESVTEYIEVIGNIYENPELINEVN